MGLAVLNMVVGIGRGRGSRDGRNGAGRSHSIAFSTQDMVVAALHMAVVCVEELGDVVEATGVIRI